jgi:hypothetical protein
MWRMPTKLDIDGVELCFPNTGQRIHSWSTKHLKMVREEFLKRLFRLIMARKGPPKYFIVRRKKILTWPANQKKLGKHCFRHKKNRTSDRGLRTKPDNNNNFSPVFVKP